MITLCPEKLGLLLLSLTVTKMMKSSLRASISPLFTGENRSISGAISVRPKPTLFSVDGHSYRCNAGFNYFINLVSARFLSYVRTLANLQSLEVGSLKRSLYSSTDEDDDFSELGSPVAQSVGTLLKLVTEKPESFKKPDSARKGSSSRIFSAESSPGLKDIPLKQGKPSPAPHLKLENLNDVFRSILNSKNASNFKSSRSITIENVPSIVHFSLLKDAISIFGKISNASMRTVPNEFGCCDVEFESVESSRRAVSVGGITIRRIHLPIRPLHALETVTIRISNISTETTDPAVHLMCVSFGPLEGLVRTEEDGVDALFNVKDDRDAQSILKKLNNTIIDDCLWSAHLLARDSTHSVMTKDAQCKLGLQISGRLNDLKGQMYVKKIYLEDLENLHHAIVHLEGQPAINSMLSDIE